MTERQVYNCIYRPQNALVYNMNSAHGIEVKGIVHQKMKITPWFTYSQVILSVYDFLLSDKYN